MVLINNNTINFFIIATIVLFSTLSRSQGLALDNVLEKKINNTLKKTYPQINNIYYSQINNNNNRLIYEVFDNENSIGYFALCRAKSMYDVFDYAIFFDVESKIKNIRIFRYNEDYGYEIAARWFLKQFFEKKAGYNMNYNYDIDGISGATISAKSVTNDIKHVSEKVSEIIIDKFFKNN